MTTVVRIMAYISGLQIYFYYGIIILCQVSSPRIITSGPVAVQDQELWLEDYSKDRLNEMQSDAVAFGQRSSQKGDPACPPPPESSPPGACGLTKCNSDKECQEEGTKCCNNGCVFTCMKPMSDPAVLDWVRQPPHRPNADTSWLVNGPVDKEGVETCSTSDILEDDEDPLLCPHGFMCHIEFLGNITQGIPNSGRCVKERYYQGKNKKHRHHFRLKTTKADTPECVLENAIFQNGATFRYNRHPCECHQGAITCSVAKTNGNS